VLNRAYPGAQTVHAAAVKQVKQFVTVHGVAHVYDVSDNMKVAEQTTQTLFNPKVDGPQ